MKTVTLFTFDYKSSYYQTTFKDVKITYDIDNGFMPVYDGDNQRQWDDLLGTIKFTRLFDNLVDEILKDYPIAKLKQIVSK